MVSQAVPMSLSDQLASSHYSPASMMHLPWVAHSMSTPHGPFKLFGPQISPYVTPRQASQYSGGHTVDLCNPATANAVGRRKSSRKVSKPSYKHVPHKDKPPHLVARRNARERRRVQAVNSAFARLRKCVPVENRSKRLSKVKTLHRAIEYINGLQAMLRQTDGSEDISMEPIHYRHRSESMTSPDEDDDDLDDVDDKDIHEDDEDRDEEEFQEFDEYLESDIDVVNKENEGQSWTALSTGCESNYWNYAPYNEDYSGSITS